MRAPTYTWFLPLIATALAVGCGGHKSSSSGSGSIAPGASATVAAVLSVSPGQGPQSGANLVTVETTGFARAFNPSLDQVTLGGAPLTSISVTSPTTIVGVAEAGSGAVDVVVAQGPEVATLLAGYTYKAAEVLRLTPPDGAAGSRVLVETGFFGQDFAARLPEIRFGAALATQAVPAGPGSVIVTVPSGAGVVDVTLVASVPAETAVLLGGWTYGSGANAIEARVETGLASPGMMRSRAPAAGIVVAQATLTSPVTATLEAFSLTADGTIDESLGLGDVVLYRDDDGDGVRDAGEPQLGSGSGFPANGAALVFAGLSETLQPGVPLHVLVMTELRASAVIGDVVAFRCEGTKMRVTANGAAIPVRGAASSGSLQVIGTDAPRTFDVAPGVNAPITASLLASAADLPMLTLTCTTTTGEIDLNQLGFRTSGSGDDAADVLEATLALDANGNGFYDAGDTVIGRGRPDRDDGPLIFSFWGRRLRSSSSSFDLVLSYTLAGTASSGETFQVTLAESGVYAHAYYGNGGQVVTLTPSPIQGTPRTVTTATSALRVKAANAPAQVVAGSQETPALALTLQAGEQDVTLNGVTVHARGTLNDASDVTGLRLYEDTNGDGAFTSGTDTPLGGPATFGVDDGALTFTLATPATIAARDATTLLVTATLANGLTPGQTLGLALNPATDVSASQTGAGREQQGTLLISGSDATALVQPNPELGKDAYLRGEGLYLNDNYGNGTGLTVGDRPSGQLGERLSYLEFPLPALPSGRTVSRAYVALFLASTNGLVAQQLDVQVFRVVPSGARTPWVEGRGGFDASMDGIVYDGTIQATHRTDQTHPDVDPTPLDEVTVPQGTAGRWVVFEITSAAQAWYAGTSPNYGLRLRDKDFARHDDGAITFWSSDVAWGALRPQLIVEHR